MIRSSLTAIVALIILGGCESKPQDAFVAQDHVASERDDASDTPSPEVKKFTAADREAAIRANDKAVADVKRTEQTRDEWCEKNGVSHDEYLAAMGALVKDWPVGKLMTNEHVAAHILSQRKSVKQAP